MTQPVHLLAGAFALDALDETGRLAFVAHLRECAECRDQAAGLAETAALLSHLTAVPPALSVRRRALAGITHVRPLPPAVRAATLPSGAVRRETAPNPRPARWWVHLTSAVHRVWLDRPVSRQ